MSVQDSIFFPSTCDFWDLCEIVSFDNKQFYQLSIFASPKITPKIIFWKQNHDILLLNIFKLMFLSHIWMQASRDIFMLEKVDD